MAEALNDGNAALGTHIVSFHPLGGTQQPSLQPRHHQHHLLSPIQLAMGPVPADAQAAGVRRSFSGLGAPLAKANWPGECAPAEHGVAGLRQGVGAPGTHI